MVTQSIRPQDISASLDLQSRIQPYIDAGKAILLFHRARVDEALMDCINDLPESFRENLVLLVVEKE